MIRRFIHDVMPREILDRTVFAVAFGLGVGGVLLLKTMQVHPFLAAGYAALVLVLYAIIAGIRGRIKIESETIGDNCYYLGFLFTLASLAHTLYLISDPTTGGGRPVDIPEVISGFGVALSSTICGVFLRVFLMQLRPDFVAKDREIRADINRAFKNFRKEMTALLLQTKRYATESVQLASERDEHLRRLTGKFIENQQDAYKDSAAKTIQLAVERDQSLRDSTEKFTEDHQESLKACAELLSKHMGETFLSAAKTAVEDISRAVMEQNKEQQAQIAETLTEIKDFKIRLFEQEAESFEEIRQRRQRLIEELENAERQMQSHNDALIQYIKITRRSADAMDKRILPALDKFEEKLTNVSPVTEALTTRILPALDDLEERIGNMPSTADDTVKRILPTIDKLNEKIGVMSSAADDMAGRVSPVLDQLEERIGTMPSTTDDMAKRILPALDELDEKIGNMPFVANNILDRILPALDGIDKNIRNIPSATDKMAKQLLLTLDKIDRKFQNISTTQSAGKRTRKTAKSQVDKTTTPEPRGLRSWVKRRLF